MAVTSISEDTKNLIPPIIAFFYCMNIGKYETVNLKELKRLCLSVMEDIEDDSTVEIDIENEHFIFLAKDTAISTESFFLAKKFIDIDQYDIVYDELIFALKEVYNINL